jgi:hypothetical protein
MRFELSNLMHVPVALIKKKCQGGILLQEDEWRLDDSYRLHAKLKQTFFFLKKKHTRTKDE